MPDHRCLTTAEGHGGKTLAYCDAVAKDGVSSMGVRGGIRALRGEFNPDFSSLFEITISIDYATFAISIFGFREILNRKVPAWCN